MKKNLVALIAVLALISCDNEAVPENEQTAENRKTIESESIVQEAGLADAAEIKGKLFYSLMTKYTQNYGFPNSVEELTNQVRYIAENWEYSRQEVETGAITPQYVISIMQNPNRNLADILKNAAISKEAGTSLIKFIENLIEVSGEDYKQISDFIYSYKAAAKENTALTEEDKEVIVTVAVISNYALYAESRRKDRDWETSVANKKASPFFNRNQAPLMAVIALIDRFI